MIKNTNFTLVLCLIFFSITFLSKPSQGQLISDNVFDLLNPRLLKAYKALQAWKHAITSDPKNFTSNWHGPHVCNYTGVYCAPAPDDNHTTTVAGIDLNHGSISGSLPEELGLLADLALFHINSNRFKGTVPKSFSCLTLLYELDISNNLFSGRFPDVVFSLSSLKFLDIRFNSFEGDIPSRLYDMKLDAIFLNDNKFRSSGVLENISKSRASVIVLANNDLNSCLPSSLAQMKDTLNEIIIMKSGLKGCLPSELGLLDKLTVFDLSSNGLVGSLPESMGRMRSLEQLNVAHNKLSGVIPPSICSLPRLENFTYSDNYFCGEPKTCLKLKDKDDRKNCIPFRPWQRSPVECAAFYKYPVDCGAFGSGCAARSPPPRPPVHHFQNP